MSGIYQWRRGFALEADANAVGEEIERLSTVAPDNTVTPDGLVKAARQSNGVLHTLFEWNDAAAASQHRLSQAALILGALVVNVKMAPKANSTALRACVTMGKSGDRSESTGIVKDYRQRAIEKAWLELESWKRRFSQYEELATACAAISVAVRKRDEARAKSAKWPARQAG